MWSALLGKVDLGKLTMDAGAGLITAIAVFLGIDAFAPEHLLTGIAADKTAGQIVILVLIAIAASYTLGILFTSLYHTSGRYLSKKTWIPLYEELRYRRQLMYDMGLDEEEFEWVQSKNEETKNTEIENKYMRYTEVTGASAFAVLLLAFALLFFLKYEYRAPSVAVWIFPILTGCVSIILFFVSAASLTKYELNKTTMVMDEIRGSSPHQSVFPHFNRDIHCFNRKFSVLAVTAGLAPVIIVIILVLYIPCFQVKPMTFPVISQLNSDDTVITLDIECSPVSPVDNQTVSFVIPLQNSADTRALIDNNAAEITVLTSQISNGGNPDWKLYSSVEIINQDALLNTRLETNSSADNGTWILPVFVTKQPANGGKKTYLLAYLKVNITVDKTNP